MNTFSFETSGGEIEFLKIYDVKIFLKLLTFPACFVASFEAAFLSEQKFDLKKISDLDPCITKSGKKLLYIYKSLSSRRYQ